jgi:hypothetical protein
VAAASWYWKAADQGYAAAQYNLGALYKNGWGVRQDYAAAASWYRKAADQGYADAQFYLGNMYYNGEGFPQDYISAQMWFYLAAAGGRQDAERNRDAATAKMTPAQIAEAQRRVAAWRPVVVASGETNLAPAYRMPTPVTDPILLQRLEAKTVIPLQLEGGAFTVPVLINNKLTLNFVLDSGSSDVSIPADVVLTLMRTGTLSAADFLGNRIYQLADGSTVPSQTFRIKSLKVGDSVIENVIGSVAPVESGLLLGQSFLRRFKSWSIDNHRQVLVLE